MSDFNRARIIQMFQWKLTDIIDELDTIKYQGFTHIQISPIQPTKEEGYTWWLLYQPTDFVIGNSQIGSREDLKRLCEEAHKRGLQIISDIVLRHVAGANDGSIRPHESVPSYLKGLTYLSAQEINWQDRHSSVWHSPGLPSLNYNDQLVRSLHDNFITDLFVTGVDGLRVDMGKHFALPEEGSDFWPWLSNKCKHFNRFVYAEAIQASRELLDRYSQYCYVGTDGWASNHDRMVVWVESHDTYFAGWTKKMDNYTFLNEYSLICKQYKHTLFYTRPFSNLWKDPNIREYNNY